MEVEVEGGVKLVNPVINCGDRHIHSQHTHRIASDTNCRSVTTAGS